MKNSLLLAVLLASTISSLSPALAGNAPAATGSDNKVVEGAKKIGRGVMWGPKKIGQGLCKGAKAVGNGCKKAVGKGN